MADAEFPHIKGCMTQNYPFTSDQKESMLLAYNYDSDQAKISASKKDPMQCMVKGEN